MLIDLRALFHSNKPYSFRQELDGTHLSTAKLERVLSRRWNNKYAVEVVSPSPYNIHYLIVYSRCNPTDLLYARRACFLIATLLVVIDKVTGCYKHLFPITALTAPTTFSVKVSWRTEEEFSSISFSILDISESIGNIYVKHEILEERWMDPEHHQIESNHHLTICPC